MRMSAAIFFRQNRNGGQGCPPADHSLEGCATTTLRRWGGWLVALVLLLGSVGAPAADVSVKASLSRSVTVIGEPVQLQIKVTGAKRTDDIPDMTAEGLEIRYTGTQSHRSFQPPSPALARLCAGFYLDGSPEPNSKRPFEISMIP